MWRNGRGDKVSFEEVLSFLKQAYRTSRVIIGTDSQPFNQGSYSVSAIAILSEDRRFHGRYFILEHDELTRHHNLFDRLCHETSLTLSLVERVKAHIPACSLEVHLDVSAPEKRKAKTSRWASTLVSMVRGYGITEVEVKPNSWCASKLADAYTKKRRIRRLANASD